MTSIALSLIKRLGTKELWVSSIIKEKLFLTYENCFSDGRGDSGGEALELEVVIVMMLAIVIVADDDDTDNENKKIK